MPPRPHYDPTMPGGGGIDRTQIDWERARDGVYNTMGRPAPGQVGSQPVRTGPRFAPTQYGPVSLPNDWSDEEAQAYVQAWQQHISTIERAMQATAGFEREQLQAQREDAQKGLDNALNIARLQAETSRYGTDQQRLTQLAQLKENARQFNLGHDLDVRRFGLDEKKFGLDEKRVGLDRARVATDFLSSPDRFMQSAAYLDLSGRVLTGQPGAGTYGNGLTPRANTEQDFAVLESGGNPYAQRGSALGAVAAKGGAGADARVKAISDLVKANPPSGGIGYTDSDYAVLNATKAIMGLNLNPQQQAAINSNPEYKSILSSTGKALGYNPEAWMTRQRQSGVGQQSVRSAG